MKKNIIKTTAIFIISLAGILFNACGNVGLGDAVDIAVPTVEISYPPKNAIVRDMFVVSGTCDDDILVSSVEVTLTNTTTKKEYGPYTATLDLERTAWTIQMNQKNGGKKTEIEYDAFDAYKQWEFPDGSYIVSAIAYDQKKKASQESSIPVDIDNTAPVLLVSKPLATGTEKASIYGRTINITGDVSEEHESTKLTLYYKEFDKTKNEFVDEDPKVLEINGFGTMSSDSPLTIAKYNKALEEGSQDLLHNNYLTIYNETVNLSESNEKLYYCGFMLEDNAKVYQNPGDTGIEGGNKTDQYYILSDSYNEELFSENTYSLNARNLMLLLSGKSSYSEEQITKIVELLKNPGNSASSTTITAEKSTKFSVDPKNNPVWSISNFELWNGDFATFETGSAVPLNLEAGGDAIAVDKNSIQIELYHLGTTPAEITAQTPHATLIKKGTYADGLLKDVLSPQNEKSIEFYKDDDADSAVSVGLNVNHYYEIIVNGSDVAGNELESKQGNRYGFKRLSSFAPPSFTFSAAQGAFTPNEYQRGSTVNENGIVIHGTVATADKDIFVQKENVQITAISITDISDSNITVSTCDINKADADENTEAQVKYSYEIKDFELAENGTENKGKAYNFTAIIKKASNASLVPQEEGAYKYKITFVAEDSLSATNEGTDFEFKLDSKAPELSDDIVISPVVNKDDQTCVNGTISITGNISDTGSGFKKLSYAIGNNAATEITNPGFHWTFDFDTTSLEDNKAYVLNIYAEDTVGNSITIPCNITVDQSTDYPQVSFTNKDTVFSKTSNVLVGNIKDDDGLDTVTVKYKKTSPVPDEEYTNLTLASFTKGTTSYSLNVSLPQSEGEYELVIYAKDIKGLATGTKTETVTVTKDNGAPEFLIKTPNTTADTYYNKNVTITGSVKDGCGLVTLSRDVYKVAGETETKVDSLCLSNLTSSISATAAQIVQGTDWTDTFVKPEEGGTYKLVYSAKDKLGTATNQTITFSIDNDIPSIVKVEFEGQDISTIQKWFHTNYGKFTVTTADQTSSVVNVRCTKDDPQGANPTWINMSADGQANQWSSTITFADAGEQKLYIKAVDKAGNEPAVSAVKEVSLKVDTVLPVLEVTQGPEGNVYVNKTVDKAFTVTYYDSASGIEKYEDGKPKLVFQIGSTDISDKVVCTPKTGSENEYDITIPKDEFVSGLFRIIGTDVAGNKTEVDRCTFIVDQKAPEIKNISITQVKVIDESAQTYETTQAYKNADDEYYIKRNGGTITISGIATDDNVLKSVALSVTDGTNTLTPAASGSDPSSWSFDIDSFDGWSDATITLTAKDEATDAEGNTAEKTINLKFDETAPVIITGECPDNRYTFRGNEVIKFNNLNLGEGRYSESSYGRMTSISVTTFVDDKEAGQDRSGLARLEYKLYSVNASANITDNTLKAYFNDTQDVDASIANLSASGTFAPEPNQPYEYYDSNKVNGIVIGDVEGFATKATANISGFNTVSSEKINYLLLRPIDNCGNEGNITILKIHVDQTAPTVVAAGSEQLTNGSKAIDISGAVYDEDAGLKALRVIINGEPVLEVSAKDADGNTITSTSTTNKYGILSYTGYAPVDPTADNPIDPDQDPAPATYPFRDAPSYAKWTLKLTPKVGQADDWFGPLGDNAEIYLEAEDWAEHEGKGNIAPNPAKVAVLKIDTKLPKIETLTPGNNTSLNGINTISGTSSDEGSSPEEVSIYYSKADDQPNHKSEYEWLQTLSTKGQNAVNVSELYNFNFDVNFDDLIEDDKKIQNIWILALVTDMAGNESLISPVLYKIDRDTDRPVIKLMTEGIDLSEMKKSQVESEDKPVLLKETQVYINITDDDGNIDEAYFRTKKAGQTLDENDDWVKIKLRNGSGSFDLKEKDDGTQSVKDGKQVVEFKIIDKNGTTFTSFDESNWKRVYIEDAAGHKLGDDNNKNPEIYALIDTISPILEEIKLSTSSSADPAKDADWSLTNSISIIPGGDSKVLKFLVNATDEGSGVKSVKAVVKINDTEVTDSPYTLFAVEGKPDYYIATIDCSKTKITDDGTLNVEIIAADGASRTRSEEFQYDLDNTAPEIVVDSPEAGKEHSGVITAVGYTNELTKLYYAVDDKATPLADDAYSEYDANTDYTTSNFYVYFDGSSLLGPNHTDLVNTWLVTLGKTTKARLESTNPNEWYDTITPLYLHLMAQDAAGNVSKEAYEILVDPQGDRPKVEFSYPKKDPENPEAIPVLGGAINIIGSVSGKAQPYTVYMQIDTNYDDENDENDWDNADRAFLESDAGGKYTLVSIPVLTNQYGIKIDANGDVWNQKINEGKEFSGKTINIRLYAVDNIGLISSAKTQKIKIDDTIPKLEQEVKLVQWDDNVTEKITVTTTGSNAGKYTINNYSAIRDYTDAMSVKGQWYVVGAVHDDNGISEIKYNNKDFGTDGSFTISYEKDGESGYIFCFPIGTGDTDAVIKSEVSFIAKDGSSAQKQFTKLFSVICDNKAPVVTPLADNLEIMNENGFYTFSSQAFEHSVNNVNQTGVERVAFYFTRDITGQKTKIIDPMIRSGIEDNGNLTDYSTLKGNVGAFEDGLYWQKVAVSSVENNKLTLSAVDDNIHAGGLAKVNGIIYLIKSIENNTITLSENPGSAATAMFAFANVIDNTIPEDIPSSNLNYDDDYGYGYIKAANLPTGTDKDLMPERLSNVGTKCTWQASINSKNISDGPVTLHYVVFDKAGNATVLSAKAKVQNNAPRIAGAWIGTDEDGNGEVDEAEFVSYHNIFEKGYNLSGKKVTNITFPETSTDAAPISLITIKRNLVIKPEIVGGNGTVGYTYKVAKRNTDGDGWADAYYSSSSPVDLGTGTKDDDTKFVQTADDKDPEIKITVKDLLTNLKETQNGPYSGDANNQKFSFTIWDSTPGLDYGTTSQSATMNVIMNVALLDSTSAKNKIIPFYWKSAEKNSLKNNSSDLGHIELSTDLANATGVNSSNPKVSGAVKLEGIAQDNSLLDSLYITIPGFNNGDTVTIAEYFTLDASNNKVYGTWKGKSGTKTVGEGANATTVTMWTTHISHATYGEYRDAGYDLPTDEQGNTIVKDDDFELPYASQEYGHVVHWTMEIDTEAMGITPKAGINITVGVKDKGKPSLSGGNVGYTQNTANNTDAYSIDVVPYIRGIKTMLSTKSKKADSSEYDRTALGHYPVASSETIYLYGFNLADGKLYDSAATPHTATLGAATKINDYDSYKGFTLYPVTDISAFISGPVYVEAGAEGAKVISLNNKNWNDAQGSYGATVPEAEDAGLAGTRTTFSNFYNRKPNQQNNYMLTDDVILDVWKFNDKAAKPAASGAIFDPIMKINPRQTGDGAGVIGFAYVSGTRRFSMANSTNSYQLWVGDYDNFSATGFAYDSAGNTYGTALGGDINTDFSNSKFAFMSSLWGTSNTTDWGTKAFNKDKNPKQLYRKHLRVEQIGQLGLKDGTSTGTTYIDKNRVQSPSIAVSGSGTSATVYLAYFDHLNQEIRFKWGANPETDNTTDYIDGFSGTSYLNDKYKYGYCNGKPSTENKAGNSELDYYNTTDFQIIAESGITNSAALGNAGPYVSIDVLPNAGGTGNAKYDIVVLTWYDKENKTLWYTYNKKDITADGNFVTGTLGTKGDNGLWNDAMQIFSNAGMYCQIKAAPNGTIHFAGYDGDSGDIRYAKLSSYDDTSVDTCIVDSNGIVGSNLTLDVALDAAGTSGKVIPYIGYYGSSGPKMAYLSDLGKAQSEVVPGAVNDMFTGYWEVTEIPTQSNAVKDRVNVGVWKDSSGVIKNSTTGTNAHAGSGNTSDNGSVYGNGTKNPVLGYEIRPSTDTGFMETAQKQ